ncbi:hypothetical protein OESDEN_24018 [Oesophagostomum dentatum]|uniref:Uncharacterized protein n=1 Tax=Oesophagostomum dentatum TaxID=61180 RepID=A0A0B1RYR2_OESDE|nr:hypothetical protein OESDEN_24018 [Oesophagostomum dentatum]
MAKSSSILFIVAFSLLLRLERWRPALGLETSLIATGLFLFTWHSSQLDLTGLLLVELAASCTGVRWTVSQLVMQREEQALSHPLDMVAHVQPWMMIPIIPLIILFEGDELSYNTILFYKHHYAPVQVILLIICGGLLAFCMEMSGTPMILHLITQVQLLKSAFLTRREDNKHSHISPYVVIPLEIP